MQRHATIPMPIRVADVDVGIAPVVEWLNTFDYVVTWFSCEGDDRDPDSEESWYTSRPYVLFTCPSLLTLSLILSRLQQVNGNPTKTFAQCEVEWNTVSMSSGCSNEQLRFGLRFLSKELLREFVANLRRPEQ